MTSTLSSPLVRFRLRGGPRFLCGRQLHFRVQLHVQDFHYPRGSVCELSPVLATPLRTDCQVMALIRGIRTLYVRVPSLR